MKKKIFPSLRTKRGGVLGMKNKIFLPLIIVVALTILPISGIVLTGCTEETPEPEETIKIGAILEFTGAGGYYGPESQKGLELALDEVDYEIAGKSIEIVYEDNGTDPTVTVEKARKLIEMDEVDLLYGPNFSDAQDAAAPSLSEYGILCYAPQGASWELHEYDNWIVTPGTLYAACKPLADYVYDQGYRTMTTLGADYVAGYRFLGGVSDRFEELGGEVVQQQWSPYGTPDYAPYVTALEPADVFVAWQIPMDLLGLLTEYDKQGLEMPIYILYAENILPDQLEELGPSMIGRKGMIGVYSEVLDYPENDEFVADYEAKYGERPSVTAGAAYVGMSVILAGLESTNGDASLEVLRPAIIELELDTVVGPVSFSETGFGVTNRWIAEVSDEYQWEVFQTYEGVRDSRQ